MDTIVHNPLHIPQDNIGYRWHPIEDYSQGEDDIVDSELKALAKVWKEQREQLDVQGQIGEFLCQLKRQWAIETGIIERIYSLDRGVTQILIEKGIEASYITHDATNKNPQLVAKIIQDQYEVVDGIFDFVKDARPLSTSYIKELHARLCRNQQTVKGVDMFGQIHDIPLAPGCYKEQPNSPMRPDGLVHEYCPPLQVASEMDRLMDFFTSHSKLSTPLPPEVEAAWLHHRFIQIHPFQDGNGRIARTLASLIFIKAGWFPLTVTRDDRTDYIDALEKADAGDLLPLIRLFARLQRNTFVSALGLVGRIHNENQISTEIRNIRSKLEARQNAQQAEWKKAKQLAEEILKLTQSQMQQTAAELKRELHDLIPSFSPTCSFAMATDEQANYYYRYQVTAMAKKNGYFANPSEYHAWCCLNLINGSTGKILVSAHSVGKEYHGIIAISACFFTSYNSEISDLSYLGKDFFQLNYEDEPASVKERFSAWLNSVLISGLALWQQGI